jgi:hypothetical protein
VITYQLLLKNARGQFEEIAEVETLRGVDALMELIKLTDEELEIWVLEKLTGPDMLSIFGERAMLDQLH